ncbi:MAG: hypothetical protein AAFV53_12465 [Myxococcota bacterium]
MVSSGKTPPKIPFARLKIAQRTEKRLTGSKRERYALASGKVPLMPEEMLGVCYVLFGDEEPRIAAAARKTMLRFPMERLLNVIDRHTHPKVLEFLAEFREDTDNRLFEQIYRQPDMNDRTARLIARRADGQLCESIANNQTRLLMTPAVLVELHANPNCPDVVFVRAESFLRVQNSLPEMPTARPRTPAAPLADAPLPGERSKKVGVVKGLDLDAEIEAALSGSASPALSGQAAQGPGLEMFDLDAYDDDLDEGADVIDDPLGVFRFDFRDGSEDFEAFLISDSDSEDDEEDIGNTRIEQKIREMTTGRRIKLAYKGNKAARAILLRDTNKLVAVAVVKSGRMTEGEISDAAANRNLAEEVIREIARTKEFTRRYQVKLALVNNAKTPVGISMTMLPWLNKRDLRNLSRSRGVPNALSTAASNLFKRKYQRK